MVNFQDTSQKPWNKMLNLKPIIKIEKLAVSDNSEIDIVIEVNSKFKYLDCQTLCKIF